MDVDTVPVGADFTDVISQAIGRCDVVIALMGHAWATATDKNGNRRIDSPDDLVRFELEEALRRNVRVLPILVQGAEMPAADELPAPLAPLVRRHAFEMLDRRWRSDLAELLSALESLAREQREPTRTQAHRDVRTQALQEAEAPARSHSPPATRDELTVDLLPLTSRGRRRGKHRLTVTNKGDRTVRVEVVVDDPGPLLELVSAASSLAVEPGTSATSWLRVRSGRVLWWGPTRTSPLRVTARPDDGEPMTVQATFEHMPVFPASSRKLVWTASVAGVLAVALVFS